MTPEHAPSILLVHGVGIGARSFADAVERLGAAGLRAVALRRRGYDGRLPTSSLVAHVQDLLGHIATSPGPVVIAGVSGGATLGLLAALAGHPKLVGALVHEPLLGPAAPAQHQRVAASIRSLCAEPGPDAVERFLERLLTPQTWATVPQAWRAEARRREDVVRAEVPAFRDLDVDVARLGRSPTPMTWSVGRRSPAWRHEAAEVARSAGVDVWRLGGAHTPQLEDPAGFVDAIVHVAARDVVGSEA